MPPPIVLVPALGGAVDLGADASDTCNQHLSKGPFIHFQASLGPLNPITPMSGSSIPARVFSMNPTDHFRSPLGHTTSHSARLTCCNNPFN
jgi:hypothetical protein